MLLALWLPATADDRRSGFADMARETQAMQQDDASNPGMLWVLEGEAIWAARCAACHGDAVGMRGVAVRYPAWDTATAAPIDLAGRIIAHQPMPREGQALLAVTAPGTEITINPNVLLGGRHLRGAVEGDADPQAFIPHLVARHLAGRFPHDRLIRTYRLEDINEAVADMKAGTAIKPVLVMD